MFNLQSFLKHYKQYSETYQHENLVSVDLKGIFGTLVMYQASCFTGVQSCRTQGTGSLPLRCSQEWYKQEEHQIQKKAVSAVTIAPDRAEEAWVWVMEMVRWGHPVLTSLKEERLFEVDEKGSAKVWQQSPLEA